jgi:WD40 repeat protein
MLVISIHEALALQSIATTMIVKASLHRRSAIDRKWFAFCVFALLVLILQHDSLFAQTTSQTRCENFLEIVLPNQGFVSALDTKPTTTSLALGGTQGITIYNSVTFSPLNSVPISLDDEKFITISALAWSPSGYQLAGSVIYSTKSAFNEDFVQARIDLWTVSDEGVVADSTIALPSVDGVSELQWSPNGRLIAAVASRTGDISVFDAVTGDLEFAYQNRSQRLANDGSLVAWSPNSMYFAVADRYPRQSEGENTSTITIFGASQPWQETRTLETIFTEIRDISWSSNELLAVVGGAIDIWDANSWQELTEIFDPNLNHQTLAWSSDSRYLAGGGNYDGSTGIVVYDILDHDYVTFTGQPNEVSAIEWTSDGEHLWSYAVLGDSITGYRSWNIYKWDITHQCLQAVVTPDREDIS